MTDQHKNKRVLLAIASIVATVSVVVTASVNARLDRFDQFMLASPSHNQGLNRVMTCEEVGLCKQEQFLLLPKLSVAAIDRVKTKGCKVRHDLQDRTSVSCPRGIVIKGAQRERVFRAQSLLTFLRESACVSWRRKSFRHLPVLG